MSNLLHKLRDLRCTDPDLINWNDLIPIVEEIESLDLKEYFYKWKDFDGDMTYNFEGICIDISKHSCYISVELLLDPSYYISENVCNNKKDAVIQSLKTFETWYRNKLNID